MHQDLKVYDIIMQYCKNVTKWELIMTMNSGSTTPSILSSIFSLCLGYEIHLNDRQCHNSFVCSILIYKIYIHVIIPNVNSKTKKKQLNICCTLLIPSWKLLNKSKNNRANAKDFNFTEKQVWDSLEIGLNWLWDPRNPVWPMVDIVPIIPS